MKLILGVRFSVNFGCISPSMFSHFYRSAIKSNQVHKNWQTIQQNEHILWFVHECGLIDRFLNKQETGLKYLLSVLNYYMGSWEDCWVWYIYFKAFFTDLELYTKHGSNSKRCSQLFWNIRFLFSLKLSLGFYLHNIILQNREFLGVIEHRHYFPLWVRVCDSQTKRCLIRLKLHPLRMPWLYSKFTTWPIIPQPVESIMTAVYCSFVWRFFFGGISDTW